MKSLLADYPSNSEAVTASLTKVISQRSSSDKKSYAELAWILRTRFSTGSRLDAVRASLLRRSANARGALELWSLGA
jgi:hypothetical protein